MPTIQSDGLLAVVAGSDMVAITLTVLWYYFLHNPLAFSRLRDEVDAYFPLGEEPLDFMRIVNIPYLNACM
jgi:cytochrome P450